MKSLILSSSVTRWFSGWTVLSIVRWLPLLLSPVVVLYTYGKIANTERKVAEQHVQQLTVRVDQLDKAIREIERFEAARQQRNGEHVAASQVLAQTPDPVLERVVPGTVADLLRPARNDP